jgi:hypothetical protein
LIGLYDAKNRFVIDPQALIFKSPLFQLAQHRQARGVAQLIFLVPIMGDHRADHLALNFERLDAFAQVLKGDVVSQLSGRFVRQSVCLVLIPAWMRVLNCILMSSDKFHEYSPLLFLNNLKQK